MVDLKNIAANYSLKSWSYAVTECLITGQYLSQWMTRNAAAQIWISYHLAVYMALYIIMHATHQRFMFGKFFMQKVSKFSRLF
jgi:hypothetical protein